MATNQFRATAELDGHKLPSIFESKGIKTKKKISYGEKYQGDILPLVVKYKKKEKQKKKEKSKEKQLHDYKIQKPAQEAFRKLDKQTIEIVDKEGNKQIIKCMDIFFQKCIMPPLIDTHEIRHFDPNRALVERWLEDILSDIKVTYETILEQANPEEELKN